MLVADAALSTWVNLRNEKFCLLVLDLTFSCSETVQWSIQLQSRGLWRNSLSSIRGIQRSALEAFLSRVLRSMFAQFCSFFMFSLMWQSSLDFFDVTYFSLGPFLQPEFCYYCIKDLCKLVLCLKIVQFLLYRVFSCPQQLNRWPCHWLTDWLTFTFDITDWP